MMNKDVRMKLKALMVGALIVVMLSGTAAYGRDTMKVKLGQQYFEIPKKNILDSGEPFWLRFIPGLRRPVAEILLTLDAEEVAENVEGYRAFDGKYKDDIVLRLEVMDEKELQQTLDPNMHVYSDPWYGRGRFEKRIIEHDQESGFYKISNESGHGVFWTAFKMYPEENQPIPGNPFDFWVASCVDGTSPLTNTGQLTDCNVKFTYQNILFAFSVRGFNLNRVDDVKEFLVNKFMEWNVSE